MAYVPPFSLIKNRLTFTTEKGEVQVTMPYEEFKEIVRLLLRTVPVDENFYLDSNPDVAASVEAGRLINGKTHFLEDGYFEGRMPAPVEVDEAYYLAANPDIAEGIKKGTIESATQHYHEHGYAEGRQPAAD